MFGGSAAAAWRILDYVNRDRTDWSGPLTTDPDPVPRWADGNFYWSIPEPPSGTGWRFPDVTPPTLRFGSD